MYSRKQLKEYYEVHNTNERLTFSTFYGRVRCFGWSLDKALSYPVKFLKLRKGNNFTVNDVDEYSILKGYKQIL